jgi:predicted nucleotidyltransferase
MILEDSRKLTFINTIKDKLSQFNEVNKIILFGSFIKSNNPNDIDIAIVQNSNDNFLTLSLKYRKVLRDLSKIIPLDIVPVKQNKDGVFLEEINKGQVVYERRN